MPNAPEPYGVFTMAAFAAIRRGGDRRATAPSLADKTPITIWREIASHVAAVIGDG